MISGDWHCNMSQSASVDQSASVVSHRGIGVPEEAIRNQGSDRQSDEAFDVIRRAILRCELRPGELVSEMDLMARLAGFTLVERFGSWTREKFSARSGQYVSVYRRA